MTPAEARAEVLKAVDLDEWVRAAGGWHAVDWRKWDQSWARLQSTRRAGLAPAPGARK